MASIDLIKASNGAGDAVQATVTSARVIGATTLKVNDVTNFPEGQFIGTTGTIDNTGVFDPSTLTVFTAHLSGTDVEIDTIAPGYADLGNTNGQVLVIKPNTLWADNVADTLAVSHNTDGTLKNNIVTTAKIADSNVTTAKIANASVTADKIDFTTFLKPFKKSNASGSFSSSVIVISENYNFKANRPYLIMAQTRMSNSSVGGGIWQYNLRVDTTVVSSQRGLSPTQYNQVGNSLFSVYTPTADETKSVNVQGNIISGGGTISYEQIEMMIIPLF